MTTLVLLDHGAWDTAKAFPNEEAAMRFFLNATREDREWREKENGKAFTDDEWTTLCIEQSDWSFDTAELMGEEDTTPFEPLTDDQKQDVFQSLVEMVQDMTAADIVRTWTTDEWTERDWRNAYDEEQALAQEEGQEQAPVFYTKLHF